MATVTIFTADRMKTIEDNALKSAAVIDGKLIITRQDNTLLDAGWVGTVMPPVTITTKIDPNYTFVYADKGTEVEGDHATGQVFTIPTNANVAFDIGTIINVRQVGAGRITITGEAGVTLRTPNGNKTYEQWSTISLVQRALNDWVISGDASL